MRAIRVILLCMLLILLVLALIWLGQWPARREPGEGVVAATTKARPVVLRLGLIPERDVFQQRAAYRALGDYLGPRLGCQVELATVTSYQGVLDDFREKRVDAAFLGSLVAALTIDRLGAQVLLRPEYEGEGGQGVSTYHGVIFVPEGSPFKSFQDLAGHTMGAVRTTTGGNLFPIYLMVEAGMIQGETMTAEAPKLVWVGTHDDVMQEVMAGRVEAGAAKDLRLAAFLRAHPDFKVRKLAVSGAVPENALLARADMPEERRNKLRDVLLGMAQEAEGQAVLKTLGMRRFMPCDIDDYHVLYEVVERVGPAWKELGIAGPPPRRPVPATRTGG